MRMSHGWRSGVLAAIAVMFLSLYPQLHLWYERGAAWSGTYALFDTDEVAYSAYLNALIDGRPRRNDPYTGRDDRADAPQPESLFSIQFATPYALAFIARVLGLSASSIFILLAPLAALVSSLVIFRLVRLVTDDERLAATALLVVLCLGTLATGQGAVREVRGVQAAYHYLPFLRRYIPAFIFPFYFALCALVWRMLTIEDQRRAALRSAILAGATFALLVYSYFYLWTAAAAWLVCLALLWLLIRPEGYRRALRLFGVMGALMIAALLPYLALVSNRAETMEAVQALTFSHAPDLLRVPEIICAVVLVALAYSAHRGRVKWKDQATIFTASFALMPFIVFNQQIITGRSLQPIHYEQFIANYVSLVAVILAWAILWRAWASSGRRIPRKALIFVAVAAFGWGIAETRVAITIFNPIDTIRDGAMPATLRLDELAGASAEKSNDATPVVLFTDVLPSDDLPTIAPQAVLWARHMHVFSGVTLDENKERFYQYLYYTGVSEQILTNALAHRDFYYILPLFGWERANPNLTVNWKPITQEEVIEELREYAAYVHSFNHDRASNPTLSYVVTSKRLNADLSNLDRWYERDAGERIGAHTLYRVKLRP